MISQLLKYNCNALRCNYKMEKEERYIRSENNINNQFLLCRFQRQSFSNHYFFCDHKQNTSTQCTCIHVASTYVISELLFQHGGKNKKGKKRGGGGQIQHASLIFYYIPDLM